MAHFSALFAKCELRKVAGELLLSGVADNKSDPDHESRRHCFRILEEYKLVAVGLLNLHPCWMKAGRTQPEHTKGLDIVIALTIMQPFYLRAVAL